MQYGPAYLSALTDFRQARRQAAMQEVLSRFTGQSTALLSFGEAYKRLRATGMADRGLKEIPVDAIVGSVNRYGDFSRTFLPLLDSDAERWAKVKSLATDPQGVGLPPIQVYQIGQAYFVSDGNHRVSVAKQVGATTVEAYVVEVQTRVPLSASANFEELILKSEYADFLECTRLDASRPDADFTMTVPGEYEKLERQIEAHRQWLSAQSGVPVSFEDGAARWHDDVYLPAILTIRDRGILLDFPGRTETDLFLWVSEHRDELEQALGWSVRPDAAAAALAAEKGVGANKGLLRGLVPGGLVDGPAPGQWRQEKTADRYTDRLFADILVPLSGEDVGWHALEQAIVIAHRENSAVHGLYVAPGGAALDSDQMQRLRDRFNRLCEEAGVPGSLAVEMGSVAATICRLALLNDLVVLNLAFPPTSQPLARLSHGFRNIIRKCARPVLAVPGASTSLERTLLAFDGSPKAREALFVATYLAEAWKASLTVVTVAASNVAPGALDYARRYLEMHEVQTRFVERENEPEAEAILEAAHAVDSQLILMGGYGASPMVEVVVGSAVDQLLRESDVPMLICR
jgi:nucleotide-binding universal stress UspA family protein